MNIYDGFDPAGSLISEKYDGICAVWDGHELTTRDGNRLDAPAWSVAGLPDAPLRGELWCGRGQFQTVLSICRSHGAGERWRPVRYMVFDGPEGVELGDHADPVRRFAVADRAELDATRDAIVVAGGEGVVVRDAAGVDWKYKPVEDDDAVVIGQLPGKGRNAHRLGALLVRDREGREFRLGAGLCDADRDEPPPVGTIVSFRFQGRTASGKPRFASFVGCRAESSLDFAA